MIKKDLKFYNFSINILNSKIVKTFVKLVYISLDMSEFSHLQRLKNFNKCQIKL